VLTNVILAFVDLFVLVFQFLLLARAIWSYFARSQTGLFGGLVSLTEPVLVPVRKVLPANGMLDLAPLVTFFGLQAIQYVVHGLLGG
jgi:YggT family protein